MQFVVVIPARYASARLPGKPLADIAGKPMVVHVADRARESGAQEIIVATDDRRIQEAVANHGHVAMMTRADHESGTDRIAEIATARDWPDDLIVVNVQGDEPRIPPQLVRSVAQQLVDHRDAAIATACHRIHSAVEMFDPNVVKVVLDKHGYCVHHRPEYREMYEPKLGENPQRKSSPLFDRVTTAEIGRRAGFSDASHFVKALRRRTGQTPLQMRRASHGKLLPPSATSAD